jgi:hypothetical protein
MLRCLQDAARHQEGRAQMISGHKLRARIHIAERIGKQKFTSAHENAAENGNGDRDLRLSTSSDE